ncbi:MAG: hypothetical protein LBM00_01325 [Deltaproteobacteria bacterium]|nr:hypothetical protein [Deltaproteobacteria bacterium]
MKKKFLLLSAFTVLLVFWGAVFCRAGEQAPSQRSEESWKVEEKILRQIREELMPYPTRQGLAVFEDSGRYRWNRAELARDKALEDIAANIPLLLLLRKDFGESFLDWVIPIAGKLPSQPVAVVQLMTNIEDWNNGQYIDNMCPMTVIEDAIPFDQYKNWLERSVAALESFTMTDAGAENIRSRCLRQIKDELATAKPWEEFRE